MVNSIIEAIKEVVPTVTALGISTCEKYRGEMEEGAEYNPNPPEMFIQLLTVEPILVLSDQRTGKKEYSFALMVADEYEAADLAEKVFDYFDGLEIKKSSNFWSFEAVKIELVGWIKRMQVMRVLIKAI